MPELDMIKIFSAQQSFAANPMNRFFPELDGRIDDVQIYLNNSVGSKQKNSPRHNYPMKYVRFFF